MECLWYTLLYINTKLYCVCWLSVCAEVQTADNMRRLARCLALIVIEVTYLQIKCTDNMKASRGKFETLSKMSMRTRTVETSRSRYAGD